MLAALPEDRGIDKVIETVVVNPGSAARGHVALVHLEKRVEVELYIL
jgi:Icc-related predicted phosphoesterase